MPETPQPQTVRIHYLKSGGYRVIHADGALSGPVPSGRGLHIAFFSERPAIPQITELAISPDGTLGQEVSKVGKEGIVREIEIDAFLDLQTAKSLLDLLTRTIANIERLTKADGKG